MKVLVADKTSELGLQILRDNGFEVDIKTGLPEQDIVNIIPEYDALIVRSATKVTAPIIEKAEKLKVIGRAGVGVDNIDVPAATKKGIIVMNAPTGNTISAAEHTIAMLMAISRNLPQAHMTLKKKEWVKKPYMGTEVFGKTLGVIGLGKIGSEVAKRMLAFGMRILIYDPFVTEEALADTEFTLVKDLKELLKQVDYLTIHIPKQEKYLIGAEELALMKKEAYLINVARGGIVDEQALCQALKEKKIHGAALDVFGNEPKKEGSVFDNELCELDNVILTPHLGASTEDAQVKVAVDIANQFVDYIKNGVIKNAVNVPTADPKASHFIPLAEKIGKLSAQLCDSHIDEIKIGFYGNLVNVDTKILKLAALKGLLSHFIDSVNYVNAPFLAKERNIKITEYKSESRTNYVNLISVEVDGTTAAGTLFEGNLERIVQINDFALDLVPSNFYALVEHKDVPGVVGKVGTILGDNKINIEAMSVGKMGKKQLAVMVLAIDKLMPDKVIKSLEKITEIHKVKSITL
jgi:D-3-phosphoglycerate dehydrogenase / 2-oxoglutarate reductase